jgi:Bacterial transcriptional activator domain
LDVLDGPAALPRLAAFHLERRRLIERCGSSRGPVKFVVAPPGFGKTVLALQLARAQPERYAYIEVREGDADAVQRRLSSVVQSGLRPIVDDAHLAAPSGVAAVAAFVRTANSGEEIIVCARSPDDLTDRRAIFDGTFDVVDASELAFTPDEIRELCAVFNVTCTDDDLAEFAQITARWPLAVCGSLRAAGERALPIGQALRAWHDTHGINIARFIIDESMRTVHGEKFLAHVRENGSVSREELQTWCAAGLFVVRAGASLEIVPAIYGVFGNAPQQLDYLQPLHIDLLADTPRTRIGTSPLKWIRHKDAQIFKYLVLKNGAYATRSELMEIFWPARDRNIAAQNLRTTCSNIRRAIRRIVGRRAVERYFESEGNLRVSPPATTDIEAFTEHMSLARLALAAGDSPQARAHFKSARDLYQADLLTGMPPCGFEDRAAALRREFGEAVHRLRTLPDLAQARATAS